MPVILLIAAILVVIAILPSGEPDEHQPARDLLPSTPRKSSGGSSLSTNLPGPQTED